MKNFILKFPYFCPRCGEPVDSISFNSESVRLVCKTCKPFSIPRTEFIERLEYAIPRLIKLHNTEIDEMRSLIDQLKKLEA